MANFLWPGVIVVVLGLPVVTALWERVPNIQDAEIVADSPQWPAQPVDIGTTERADGTKVSEIRIHQERPEQLVAHSAVRLLFVTFKTTPTLIEGVISVEGTTCSYRTRSGAAIVDNNHLAFYRGPGCGPSLSGTPTSRLDLTVSFRGRHDRVGLATYTVPPTSVEPTWMSLSAPIPGDPRPLAVVRGRYVDDLDGPGRRRIELLSYVWDVSDSSAWIWGSVGLALMLIVAGSVGVNPARPSTSAIGRATGVGALALGLALLYAVLVPPLQAPDEPDHMLTFAAGEGRQDLADTLATLARLGHFERIHFRAFEHFRSADVGHPFPTAWGPDVFVQPVAGRSVTTSLWWKLLAPTLSGADASGSLLGLRLANAVMFSVLLGLAALLSCAVSRQAVAPHMVCVGLLLIPTLPYFASHVSEFAILTSAYVFVAVVMAASIVDDDRVHLLGLPLGLAASCILAGGRSGLPFAATLLAAVAGRALLGSPNQDSRDDTRRSVIFWTGLTIGLAMFAVLSTPEFRGGLWPADAGRMPDWFRSAAELFRRHPSYVAIVMPIGLAFELGVTRIRRRIPAPGRLATGVVKIASVLGAAAVLTSVLLSALVSYPALGFVDGVTPPSSAGGYASEVLRVAATGFRIGNHDWLLSASFWAGFGWLDTMPGDGLVSLLVVLTALGIMAVLANITRTGHVRRAIWLGVLGAGWIVTLVLYAVSSYYLHRNLHGRYLVGLYLSMLAVCGSSLALWPRAPRPDVWWLRGLSREWSVLLAAAAIHAYALRFILFRYF